MDENEEYKKVFTETVNNIDELASIAKKTNQHDTIETICAYAINRINILNTTDDKKALEIMIKYKNGTCDSYTRKLIELMYCGDNVNLSKLAIVYPNEMYAYTKYKGTPLFGLELELANMDKK